MSDKSNIEWTDATWNPVRGCVKVSAGCKNCYAETFAERFRGVPGHPYEQGFDLRLVPEKLDEPLRWRAGIKESCPPCMGSGSKNDAISCGACAGRGWTMRPKRVFVNSMSDLFQDGVPDTYIADVFATMARCPQHTFQVLTKRADRMKAWMENGAGWMTMAVDFSKSPIPGMAMPWPLPNVWLGCSVENQHFADERIPLLLQTPAAVRFISAEPLLSAVDLDGDAYSWRGWLRGWHCEPQHARGCDGSCSAGRCPEPAQVQNERLDWVIVGGESGHGARPMHPDWTRSIRNQCQAAGVAFFFKQWGEWVDPAEISWAGYDDVTMTERGISLPPDDRTMWHVGKKAAGRLLDGREWSEFPQPGAER